MKFYLTAAIPYVNAKPHLGHALEFVQGDAIARFHRQKGDEVFYISGADENSLKMVQAAEKERISVQELVKKYSQTFVDLAAAYKITFDNFLRSTDPAHIVSAQDLWKKCEAAGDIYKKKYKGLYCVGCEQFYARDELNEKGECFEHPGKPLDEVEEENYFFKLSNYQRQIEELLISNSYKIVPENRKNEVMTFVKEGLQDFSISRTKERAKGWGVPVPGDPNQIMYVWFDALNTYRSAAPKEFWPANLHVIGKGIIRFHAIYWPAILLSAKLPLPKELFVHGYITVNGQKMSKTVGNVIDPMELIKKYGMDPVRYYLLREIPSDGDGDYSEEKFKTRYNADLANGLGNFASRVLTLAAKLGKVLFSESDFEAPVKSQVEAARKAVEEGVSNRKLHEALAGIWKLISLGDGFVNATKPWEMEEKSEEFRKVMANLLYLLHTAANLLAPFLPDTSDILKQAVQVKDSSFVVNTLSQPLFARL